MKLRITTPFLILALTTSLFTARAADTAAPAKDLAQEIKSAAQSLAGKHNYSWKTTVESAGNARFRPGPTEGKTAKDSYTHLTLSRGENTYEAVMKGGRTAVKLSDGWKTIAEATEAGGEGRQNPGRMLGRVLQNFKLPAAEAESLSQGVKEWKRDGDVLTGELNEETIKQFASFGGRRGNDAPTTTPGKGSVKIWIKDGTLQRYEYHVEAKVSFNGNDMDIDRTTNVEIKDIDTTKISVPEEAQKKLS